MTQLWIAMCMYLLLSHLKFASHRGWGLAEILRLPQLDLFERRPLDDRLGNKTHEVPRPAFYWLCNRVNKPVQGKAGTEGRADGDAAA